jgi:general secretion pathway protein A
MYETFFGLSDLPFRLTPDPRYLFMSAKHREAFAHLVYGISEGSGFVAITGEVGAGKTTLIRALLAEHAKDVTVASIVNPVLTSTELLQTINAELGLPSRSTSRKELTEELAAFLKSNRASGRRTVIIVDEAQNLDPVVLEQLRLLTNLETETEKLLQVVLVGQPELHGILQRHDLRQLNQRVTERWHLDKLDRDEAVEYIRHRLRVAGAQTELVDPKALDLLFRFTDGVPRLLNILGHRSMLVAFTRSRGRVGTDEVAAAARELGYTPQVAATGGGAWKRLAAFAAAAVAVAVVAFLLVLGLNEDEDLEATRSRVDAAPIAAAAPAPARAASVPQPVPVPAPEEATATEAEATPAVEATTPPAEPVPADADAASLARLAAGAVFDAAVADYSRLLESWGAAPVGDGDLASGSLNLQAIAESRGLRYFAAEVNDALLALLDLPALVEMTPLPGGELRYVLLRSLDRGKGRALVGHDVALGLTTFNATWNGKAHVLFRDPEGLRYDLATGSGGPAVRKLQKLLAEVGFYDGSPTGLFDDLTQNGVRRFQEAKGIAVDGVAGPITQILLYNSLARFDRPTLAPGASAAPAPGSAPEGNP